MSRCVRSFATAELGGRRNRVQPRALGRQVDRPAREPHIDPEPPRLLEDLPAQQITAGQFFAGASHPEVGLHEQLHAVRAQADDVDR